MPSYTGPEEILLAVGIAMVTVLAGWFRRKIRNPEEKFKLERALSTLIIGLVAGVIVVIQGLETNPAGIAAAVGIAVPLVDKFYNEFAPPSWGGSSPADYYKGRAEEETEETDELQKSVDEDMKRATHEQFEQVSKRLREE